MLTLVAEGAKGELFARVADYRVGEQSGLYPTAFGRADCGFRLCERLIRLQGHLLQIAKRHYKPGGHGWRLLTLRRLMACMFISRRRLLLLESSGMGDLS